MSFSFHLRLLLCIGQAAYTRTVSVQRAQLKTEVQVEKSDACGVHSGSPDAADGVDISGREVSFLLDPFGPYPGGVDGAEERSALPPRATRALVRRARRR